MQSFSLAYHIAQQSSRYLAHAHHYSTIVMPSSFRVASLCSRLDPTTTSTASEAHSTQRIAQNRATMAEIFETSKDTDETLTTTWR